MNTGRKALNRAIYGCGGDPIDDDLADSMLNNKTPTDKEILDWLEKANGVLLSSDGGEWFCVDKGRFVAPFLFSANGTRYAPKPTLRETLIAAMLDEKL